MSRPIQPSGTSTPSSSRRSVSASNALARARGRRAGAASRCRVEQLARGLEVLVLAQRVADRVALGGEEREAHRAADEDRVGALQEGVEHADLVGHLGAADDRHERARRVLEDAGERPHLALEQPPGGARQQVRDALGRGVRAVRGAERVVDVDVGERGVALRELGVVLRLPRLEADVLEHHDVAVGHVVEVGRELHLGLQQLAQARRRRAPARATRRGPWAGRGARSSSRRAPRSRSRSSVGSAARMRVSSVIRPSSSGTLKSTRTRTRLPSTSRSSSVLTGPSARRRRSGWSSPTRCRTRRRP